MKFTNMTRAGLYFTSCHREVAPGESFELSWLEAKGDRAIRAAMRDGAVAWESGKDEPHVPGSATPPGAATAAEQAAARQEEAARRRADAARVQARQAADDRALKEHMSRMGKFKVPGPIPRRAPERPGAREKPVTAADIISDGKPKSLADVIRHNRAVRLVQAQEAAKAAKAKREQQDQNQRQNP